MLKSLAARRRSRRANARLGCLLAFVAGAINAGGFIAVGYYTSHMSGIVSSIADYIVVNKLQMAGISALFLFSFIIGASSSAIIINWGRSKKFASLFAIPLMFEALLLMLFGISANMLSQYDYSVTITIMLLCYTMGLQNAIITKISNAEIRTTHVTGLATDIGIECGRFIFSLTKKARVSNFHPMKLKLHTALLLSFLLGGITGAYAFKAYGFIATLPFSAALMVTAAAPIIEDVRRKRKS